MAMLVRLKPYNEKKGNKTRIYMINGFKFLEANGWYEVPDAFAETLKDLHQNHYDEESPLLFDVATKDEADKIDQKEEDAKANARASARAPQKFKGKQRTQALPVNNAGGLAGIPTDFSTEDLYNGINGTQPAGPGAPSDPLSDRNDEDRLSDKDLDDLDEGRATEVGKVKPRTSGSSGSAKK